MKLKISFAVILLGVIAALSGKIQLFLSYTVAMVLHEAAHAEVAARLGFKLTELKIMPYGAAICGKLDGMLARDELIIAIAGPIFSMAVATLFVSLWWLFPESYFFTADFVVANVSLGLFNLLPVYPLDGGRVTLAILRGKTHRAELIMKIIGCLVSLALLLAFAVTLAFRVNFTLLAVGAFLLVSALIPEKRCRYERLYSMAYRMEKCRRGLPVKYFAVTSDCPLSSLKKRLSRDYYSVFRIIDRRGAEIEELDLEQVWSDSEVKTAESVKIERKSKK